MLLVTVSIYAMLPVLMDVPSKVCVRFYKMWNVTMIKEDDFCPFNINALLATIKDLYVQAFYCEWLTSRCSLLRVRNHWSGWSSVICQQIAKKCNY